MYFDISGAAIGESASFTVAKDTSQAKAAIDNFVENSMISGLCQKLSFRNQ